MDKDRNEVSDWCPARDWVLDMQRYYRCSECNKRLLPREAVDFQGYFKGYQLPKHKRKGWKIKRAKARKQK